jgi:hypothetical protein
MHSFRTPLTIFALVAFASIAVFGFATQHHGGEVGWCVAESAQGAVCLATDGFGIASFHLKAFKQFAQNIVPALVSLFLAIAAVFLASAVFRESVFSSDTHRIRLQYASVFTAPTHLRFMRWLSRREKRDPSFL